MSYRPKGAYGVLMTAFNQNGNVDFEAVRKQINYLSKSKLSGIVVCGTTSEFVQMTQQENMESMKCAAEYSNNKFDVITGACASNIKSVIELANNAKALGLPAVLVCPPFYTPLTQEDIVEFYITLSSNIDIDIILYNIPAFTNKISFETLKKLINIKNVIGIKDSSGNMKDIISYVNLAKKIRPDFVVLTGTDQMILPALTAGCVGSMTALSGIIPELNTAVYDAFYKKDYEKALELQLSTIDLLNTAEEIVFPAGYKIIAEKMGYKTGEVRQVIQKAGTQRYKEIEKIIEDELKGMGIAL